MNFLASLSLVMAVAMFSGMYPTTANAIGSMSLRSSVGDISRNIRKQVRQALRPTLTINRQAKLPVTAIDSDAWGRYLLSMHGSSLLVWDMADGNLLAREDNLSIRPTQAAISENARYVLVGDAQGRLQQLDLHADDPAFSVFNINASATQIAYSRALEAWLVSSDSGELLAVKPANGEQIFRLRLSTEALCCMAVLPLGEVAVATVKGDVQLVDTLKQGLVLDRWDISTELGQLLWSESEKQLLAVADGGDVFMMKAGVSQPRKLSRSSDAPVVGLYDGVLYRLQDNGRLLLQSLDDGSLEEIEIGDDIAAARDGLVLNSELLLVAGDDGLIYGLKPRGETLQLRWVVTRQGWTAVDAQGRFDGSVGGVSEVAWTAEGRSIGLEGFASSYYEPGLLKKLAAAERQYFVNPARGIGDGIYFPPEVDIDIDDTASQASIQVTARAKTGDGMKDIGRLYLYHNSKRIPSHYQTEHTVNEDEYSVSWKYTVPLVKGENSFYASVSAWSDIRAQSDRVAVNTGAAATDSSSFVVSSIGINRYAEDGLVLNYSVADAQAVANRFSDEVGSEKGRRIKSIILNDEANSRGIRRNLAKLAELNPADTAVLFLSGHGVAVDGNWYFLPQESRSLEDSAHIREVGISGRELAEAIIASPAQKVLLAVDACQSGAVLNDFQTFSQRKSLQQLSDDTGIHILTATRADQLAPEYEVLGHGLFTYTLLKALERREGVYNADRWPRDNNLTVGELKKYVLRYAPLLARKLNESMLSASAQRGADDLDVLITPAQLTSGVDFRLN